VGSFEAKDFSGAMIQFVLEDFELAWRDRREIEAFWKIPTQQSDDVLHGTFLPGTVGITEEDRQAEGLVLRILCSPIEGEGASQRFLNLLQAPHDGFLRLRRGFIFAFCEEDVAGFSFLLDGNDLPFLPSAQHRVSFPISESSSGGNRLWPLFDARHNPQPLRASRCFQSPSLPMPPRFAPGQVCHEAFFVRPLIDRLVGDDRFSLLFFQCPRNDFRRPTFFEVQTNVCLQLLILHRISAIGVPLLHAGTEMGGIRFIPFSGTISTATGNLHTETTDGTPELLPDDTQAQSFSEICSKNTTLFLREMDVGRHRTEG